MSRDMSLLTCPDYLHKQYRDATNLNARVQLHTLFSTNEYGWTRWAFDHFGLPAGCRLLELGCGPANLWVDNLDRIPGGWDVTLTDLSPGMVQQARGNLAGSEHPFSFRQVDAQEIPYDDDTFDAVIANHMLYHVPDMDKALAEMRRVLRSGGRFYTSTVGLNHMRELFDLVHRFAPEFESPPIMSFTLENGPAVLSPWFARVTLHRYEDSLVVTEAEPLLAYVLSGRARSVLTGERLAAFVEHVEREIAEKGEIRIGKDSGLFEAVAAKSSP